MKKFAVLKIDGSLEFQEVSSEGEYDFLSNAVGGWIQAVTLDYNEEVGDLVLWCNEEGKLNGLPANESATRLWEFYYGKTDIIVGDVVLTGGSDDEGETLPLSETRMVQLAQLFQLV